MLLNFDSPVLKTMGVLYNSKHALLLQEKKKQIQFILKRKEGKKKQGGKGGRKAYQVQEEGQ